MSVMLRRMGRSAAAVALAWIGMGSMALAAPGNFPTFTDGAAAGPDFAIQGEYAGELTSAADQEPHAYGAHLIARGEGKFDLVLYQGGLPGAGWKRGAPRETAQSDGQTKGGKRITFSGPNLKAEYVAADKTLVVFDSGGQSRGKLDKVTRESPTLGAKPPEGAVVLFAGADRNAFRGGTVTPEGWLQVGPAAPPADAAGGKPPRGDVLSEAAFGDFTLHLEFRSPYMPTATGQARGNSGVYLQNRYEVQVLDSFGLEGADNECGGIYKASRPDVNMCLPPLAWQTYDIDFTAPRFDADGKKTAPARVTVRHNGVVIHEDLELPAITPGGFKDEQASGPLKLQDHGNPVQFRNVWLVQKKS